jgi:DNA-binding HxlR family transcriptional regulator
MRNPRIPDPRVCSIDAAMKIIGEKWALLVLRELTLGETRFDDLAHNTGASRDILAARLKALESAGVILKRLYEERPARYEYHLSEAGEQLFGVLHAIRDWGDQYVRTDPENVVVFRHSCGSPLDPRFSCGACGEEVSFGDVESERDVRRSQITG